MTKAKLGRKPKKLRPLYAFDPKLRSLYRLFVTEDKPDGYNADYRFKMSNMLGGGWSARITGGFFPLDDYQFSNKP